MQMAVNLQSPATALIVVDVQNDFRPGGALAVTEGDAVIEPINALMRSAGCVVLTADWHPAEHESFACNHAGCRPFETIVMPYGEQVLWPAHCVAGTHGARFAETLQDDRAHLILRKGTYRWRDSYSAFVEADGKTTTGLAGWLRQRGISSVLVCGLAADYCVSWTALDAAREGFATSVVIDATRAIAEATYEQAKQQWRQAGIDSVTSSQLVA